MNFEISLVIAFVSGLFFGISPCILLLLSTFGTSLILGEEKSKFLKISFGLISGIIITFIIISYLIFMFVEFAGIFQYINIIFAIVLICLGIWQIIVCRKEDSTLYSTPQKVKVKLKEFIDKRSGSYAFLVGIIFALIKLPTCGSLLIVLILNLHNDPLLFVYIFVYIIGMIIPIIIILVLLRIGLESSKIDDFRLRHRAHLRLLSGITLIFLAFYLLILDELFNATF